MSAVPEFVLTFDNGPDPTVTPAVLESLEARGHQAIFLPMGQNLESGEGQATLRRIADAGHVIGNHTYSHPNPFGSLPGNGTVDEIRRTQELLGEYAGSERYFRPSAGGGKLIPGVFNEPAVDHLRADGYTVLLWHAVCEDWKRPDGSWIDLALDRLVPDEPTVLVLHDVADAGMDHFERFLDVIAERGIGVTTEVPRSVTPIVAGELVGPIDHLLPA